MPHPIRPLAVLSLLAALAAPVGDANATRAPAPAAVTVAAPPVARKPSAPRGGMCSSPNRCPDGYRWIGPPTCSCVPKPKPAPKGGRETARQ